MMNNNVDDTKEIWRKVTSYNGVFKGYLVSNMGRVKALGHAVKQNDRGTTVVHHYPTHFMHICNAKDGYSQVHLKHDGHSHTISLHQLVARAFVPNPHHYRIVNHKNENRKDDRACNLEWCSQKYNCHYGNRTLKNYLSTIIKHAGTLNTHLLDSHDVKSIKQIFTLIHGLHCVD